MKQSILFIAVLSFAMLSCKKDAVSNSPATLNGNWKMIAVKDNTSGSVVTKPASIQGDILITFSQMTASAGTFSGHTPTNEVSPSNYRTAPGNSLTILDLMMTKVWETSWGAAFVNSIRDAQHYSFEKNGDLDIITISNTLVFQRQ